jgi:hypothetical protein
MVVPVFESLCEADSIGIVRIFWEVASPRVIFPVARFTNVIRPWPHWPTTHHTSIDDFYIIVTPREFKFH